MASTAEFLEGPTFYEMQAKMGTKLVNVNNAGFVFAKPGERTAIATYGLAICTAVVVQFEKDSESLKGALLAHYDPNIILRYNVGNDLRVRSEHIPSLGINAKALIVSSGVRDSSSPTGYSPSPTKAEQIKILTGSIRNIFGAETDITCVGFEPFDKDHPDLLSSSFGRKKPLRGTVLVEYPSVGLPSIQVDGIPVVLPARS